MRIKLAIVLVILSVSAYMIVQPSRVDTCASEVLTNGRGVSINLATKTFKFGAEGQEVPISSISEQSAIVIDALSRLCRENESKTIETSEYRRRFDQIISPITANIKRNVQNIHLFEGNIDAVGYVGNKEFLDFLDSNVGNVVRINTESDVSADVATDNWDKNCYWDEDTNIIFYNGETSRSHKQEFFNRTLPLPLKSIDENWKESDGSSHLCEEYTITFNSSEREEVSASGNARSVFINGFFKVKRIQRSWETHYELTEVPATPSDFAN